MYIFELKVDESPESNDHQVRIYIDCNDYLSEDYLGIDPPNFFDQDSLLNGGEAIIGRCCCGVEGCGDLIVNIELMDHLVVWSFHNGQTYEFVPGQYISTINKHSNDYSWEDVNRTAERLVTEVFKGKKIKGNYRFKWASARIKHGFIKLSFEDGYGQKLLNLRWNCQDPKSALASAKKAIKEMVFL